MSQLSGKIYFVQEDFSFVGTRFPKKNETQHSVLPISNITIDEHMIKFFIPLHEFEREMWSYNVNLVINDTGTHYKGTFSEDTEPEHTGEVQCELFTNNKNQFLFGRWFESELVFTWWAVIAK